MANRVKRADHLNLLAFCLIRTRRVTEAVETSTQAVAASEACRAEQPESQPVSALWRRSRHNHATSLRNAGRFNEAIHMFDTLIGELHSVNGPSDSWVPTIRYNAAQLYRDRGKCRYGLRRIEDSVSDYDSALQYAEENNWLHITLSRALSLAHCGRTAEAIEQCRGPLSNPRLDPWCVFDVAQVHAAASVALELTSPQREAAAREAVELLKRAIAGDANVRAPAATQTELLPLRDRADFQAVIGGR